MIVVPNQLYSFHYSQVPGFHEVYELARQHSYAPVGFDERSYLNLPPEHRLSKGRATLDNLPNEEAILLHEHELSQSKRDQVTIGSTSDVETVHNRQVLEGLTPYNRDEQIVPSNGKLPRRETRYRIGSGYTG